jgi:formate C-acetyltransferase
MLSERTQHIKDSLFEKPRKISLERALLVTESYKSTEGEAPVIRRAKAFANILAKHKLVLDDYDLLVGNRSEEPRAGVVSPEMSPYWILDELDLFPTREQDRFEMDEQDKKTFTDQLYPYWAGRTLRDWYVDHCDIDVVEAEADKVFAVAQTDKGQGHIIADFQYVLENGLGGVLADIRQRLDADPDNEFLQAAEICYVAMIGYVGAYRELVVEKMAGATEERLGELQKMAEVLGHIATEPARDLYDALQLVWLLCVALQQESNASSLSLGRMDQYLLPYYRATVEAGVSEKDIRELLTCFYLKCNTIVAVRSSESAKFFAGFPIGYNLVVGGVDENGEDATNELSILMLDLQKDTRLPQPNLSVRVNAQSPDELLHKASEIIRLGDGLPQLFNDEVNIESFERRGVSPEDAADYAVVGCVELSIPGRMYGLHDISMFNMLKCFELVVQDNPDGFDTFEDLVEAVENRIDHYVGLMVKGCNACDEAHRETSPTPFLSVLVHDSLENGADITAGGARYNPSGVQGVGTANLADSLYVVKHAVFEDKTISWQDLRAMLARDWTGEGDEIWRQRFINTYAKYGNDVDEVDELGTRLLRHYGHEVAKYGNVRGGKFQPGSYTVSAHVPLGAAVGATPDGRRAHEQLADGGLSPMAGRDQNGPTASLLSVSKLDNVLDSNGSLLNVKFSPATLEGEGGLAKLMAYIRAFSRLGIQHIQFNVVDRATLLDAQEHPEDHKDLVVRVAGYSAMFVELSKAIQDDIINRTEHVL